MNARHRPPPDEIRWQHALLTPPQHWKLQTRIGPFWSGTMFRLEHSTAAWRFGHFWRGPASMLHMRTLLELPSYLSEADAKAAAEAHYWLNTQGEEWIPT